MFQGKYPTNTIEESNVKPGKKTAVVNGKVLFSTRDIFESYKSRHDR